MSAEIISTENLNEAKELWAISLNNFNGLIDSHLLANKRIAELESQLAAQSAALQVTRELISPIAWNNTTNDPSGLAYQAIASIEEGLQCQ